MDTNLSLSFLEEIDRVARMPLPEAVAARIRLSLLDYLAVTCAGAAFQRDKMERYLAFSQPEVGNFKVIGMGKNLALKEAVFLNGLNAHALDYDDGTNSGIIHLGSPIFSLLIPLAQRYGTSIEKMLHAAVVGYETSYTMAVSIQPVHKALGFHATGTCGVLGATLAAAYMLDFTDEERRQAFAAASVSASGMLKVLDDGSELKPYNVAKSAMLSLTSLQLAKAGFKGHDDPLGGYRGFLKMMTGDEHTVIRPILLDGTYAVMKSYTKPYASCRYTHPPVEAAIRLRKRYGIQVEDVRSVSVRTYNLAVSGHNHTDVRGSYSAKMSTPYSVAVSLVCGQVGLAEFEPSVMEDPRVRSLARMVTVEADEEMSRTFPEKQSAEVVITTANGTFSERVDFPKGEPENPLNKDEFYERYCALMTYGGIDRAVYDKVYTMEKNAGVSELVREL